MNDTEFLASFETASFEPGTFHHREHIRIVWLLLRRFPLLATISRVRAGLRLFVAKAGAEEKYHETITVALVLIVHERTIAAPTDSFARFEETNPDLFEWRNGALLEPYYDAETLATDLARAAFVPPERFAPHAVDEARP